MSAGHRFCTHAPRATKALATITLSTALTVWPSVTRAMREDGVAVHGFASQGFMLSTGNSFAGKTKSGSFDLTEAAVTIGASVSDDLRLGLQLITMRFGDIGGNQVNLDWGYLEYSLLDWLRVRAGRIKVPLGLYTEILDIDAARTPILLPQCLYDIGLRLIAFNGASLIGTPDLGSSGALEAQLYAGKFEADIFGVIEVKVRKGLGGRLVWEAPVEGLRIGWSTLFGSFANEQVIDATTASLLYGLGVVDKRDAETVKVTYQDVFIHVASIEYNAYDVLFAAEYSRWEGEAVSKLERFEPVDDLNWERYYVMLGYRFTDWLQVSTYYSVRYENADDKEGTTATYASDAWQRDLTGTIRFDVTPNWLIKLEAHVIDGTAALAFYDVSLPDAEFEQSWSVFLAKTTVFF